MDGSGILSAASGATPVSPASPMSARPGANGYNGHKRKRESMVADSSPGSIGGQDEDGLDHDSKKRQPGVKRACNECRQQKVSHHHHDNFFLSIPALASRPWGLTLGQLINC